MTVDKTVLYNCDNSLKELEIEGYLIAVLRATDGNLSFNEKRFGTSITLSTEDLQTGFLHWSASAPSMQHTLVQSMCQEVDTVGTWTGEDTLA